MGDSRQKYINKPDTSFIAFAAMFKFLLEWEENIAYIDKGIKNIEGVTTEVVIPPTDNNMPTLKVSWDPAKIGLTSSQMDEKLKMGTPSINVISWELENSIRISMHALLKGEEKAVAIRVKDELMKASV